MAAKCRRHRCSGYVENFLRLHLLLREIAVAGGICDGSVIEYDPSDRDLHSVRVFEENLCDVFLQFQGSG